MGKFTTYIFIMTGLLILFHFMGLIEPDSTPNSVLLNILMNPQDISFSDFFNDYILLTLTTGAGIVAGIIIGFVTKNAELAAMIGIATYLGTILWDFIAVYNVVAATNQVLAILLLGPLLFVFSITLVDWWRGRD